MSKCFFFPRLQENNFSLQTVQNVDCSKLKYQCMCAPGFNLSPSAAGDGTPTCSPVATNVGCPANDPCATRYSTQNKCTPQDNGLFRCTCTGAGWLVVNNGAACIQLRCSPPSRFTRFFFFFSFLFLFLINPFYVLQRQPANH